jgi:hypothetical protein
LLLNADHCVRFAGDFVRHDRRNLSGSRENQRGGNLIEEDLPSGKHGCEFAVRIELQGSGGAGPDGSAEDGHHASGRDRLIDKTAEVQDLQRGRGSGRAEGEVGDKAIIAGVGLAGRRRGGVDADAWNAIIRRGRARDGKVAGTRGAGDPYIRSMGCDGIYRIGVYSHLDKSSN